MAAFVKPPGTGEPERCAHPCPTLANTNNVPKRIMIHETSLRVTEILVIDLRRPSWI